MKHWNEFNSVIKYLGKDASSDLHKTKNIVLNKGENRILSVTKSEDGIQFMEECDRYYRHTYTKAEALELINELLDWVESS